MVGGWREKYPIKQIICGIGYYDIELHPCSGAHPVPVLGVTSCYWFHPWTSLSFQYTKLVKLHSGFIDGERARNLLSSRGFFPGWWKAANTLATFRRLMTPLHTHTFNQIIGYFHNLKTIDIQSQTTICWWNIAQIFDYQATQGFRSQCR